MDDAWEEVPQHQGSEDLRSFAQEGNAQVQGSGHQQRTGQEEEEEEVAILIMPDDLEAFLERAHNGEKPVLIMAEIYANTEDAIVSVEDGYGDEEPA